MTGAQFLDELVGSSSNPLGYIQKSLSDADYRKLVLKWLQNVGRDIETRQDTWHWRFLEKTATFPTVANQITYDLPTDLSGHKIFSVSQRGSGDHKLTYMEMDKFRRLVPDPSEDTGFPRIYTLWADGIRLWPIPAAVYTMYMDYVKDLTTLADNSTAWEIPSKYDSTIIEGVLAQAYKFEPELGNQQVQINLYEAGITRMKLENNMVIDHISKSRNHRGNRGGLFPLERGNGF